MRSFLLLLAAPVALAELQKFYPRQNNGTVAPAIVPAPEGKPPPTPPKSSSSSSSSSVSSSKSDLPPPPKTSSSSSKSYDHNPHPPKTSSSSSSSSSKYSPHPPKTSSSSSSSSSKYQPHPPKSSSSSSSSSSKKYPPHPPKSSSSSSSSSKHYYPPKPTKPHYPAVVPTCTVTTESTITWCPKDYKCHGQTVTWTSTQGPVPCAADITCICKLPPAPPVIDHCPYENCHGETLTWDHSEEGPSKCASTCTVELPTYAAPLTEAQTVYAQPTSEATPETPTSSFVTVPVEAPTTSQSGPVLQSVNAAPLERGSWAAAALAAGVAAFI